MRLELSDDYVNELQRRSIIRLVDRLKHAKSIDIHCRINGEDKVLEADWLKHLTFDNGELGNSARSDAGETK